MKYRYQAVGKGTHKVYYILKDAMAHLAYIIQHDPRKREIKSLVGRSERVRNPKSIPRLVLVSFFHP